MAKTITVSSGAHKDLNFPCYESAEEFDRAAGEVGACLDEAQANLAYRSTLPEFHKTFFPQAEALSGIKRNVNEEATRRAKARAKDGDKVEDVMENYAPYSNRVKANLSAADWAAFDTAAHECAASIAIDASPSKRQAGPGKELLSKADSLLTLPQDQLQAKIDKYTGDVQGFELETDENGKPERVSFARLLGKWLDYQLAQG